MSRAAVTLLSAGAPFGARLERSERAQAHGVDRLLASQAGRLMMLAMRPGRPAALAYGRRVLQQGDLLAGLDEAAFGVQIEAARARLQADGPQGDALAAGLAVACEAARRCLGKTPYAVQVLGARELVRGRIIEMATGEGKSLTAALAAAVLAGSGLPVDIFTVNDYLARRDAELMRPLFDRLGLSVASVDAAPASPQRLRAYAADVVYVVNKDYVFDYLRHRQTARSEPFAGRGLFFAIVDEADSILVDEARTPLILARETVETHPAQMSDLLALAQGLSLQVDCSIDRRERSARLGDPGKARLRQWAKGRGSVQSWPEQILQERLEQALCAVHLYQLDRDYVVRDGKVQIVDEYTGRILADRSWQRGLHQFIELKEGLPPTAARETLSRLTYPQFFRKYLRVAGMSGTVAETAGELRRNYGAQVVRVPTHRPVQRALGGPFLFAGSAARWAAVVDATHTGLRQGRAVLIGTRSVQASEHVARLLAARGIDHVVLNARNDACEAAIVAEAGRAGRVTVATNMAGRGTDIVIDGTVRAAGGLLVILTEFHESTRVDRQLYGRCARQGDPGKAMAFASLEDDLFMKSLPPFIARAAAHLHDPSDADRPLPRWLARPLVFVAQWRASARQRADRDLTLANDDALRDQFGFAGGPA